MTHLTLTFDGPPEAASGMHRSLADWLTTDERLRRATRLVEEPPPPGALGGLAVAVELVTASASVLSAAVSAVGYWLGQRMTGHPVSFTVTHADGSSQSFSADRRDWETVLAAFERFAGQGGAGSGTGTAESTGAAETAGAAQAAGAARVTGTREARHVPDASDSPHTTDAPGAAGTGAP